MERRFIWSLWLLLLLLIVQLVLLHLRDILLQFLFTGDSPMSGFVQPILHFFDFIAKLFILPLLNHLTCLLDPLGLFLAFVWIFLILLFKFLELALLLLHQFAVLEVLYLCVQPKILLLFLCVYLFAFPKRLWYFGVWGIKCQFFCSIHHRIFKYSTFQIEIMGFKRCFIFGNWLGNQIRRRICVICCWSLLQS